MKSPEKPKKNKENLKDLARDVESNKMTLPEIVRERQRALTSSVEKRRTLLVEVTKKNKLPAPDLKKLELLA